MKQPKLKRFAVPSQNLPKKRYHSDVDPQEGPSNVRGQRLFKRHKRKEEQNYSAVSDVILCESGVTNFEETKEQTLRTEKDLTEDERVVVQNLLRLGNIEPSVYVDKEIQVTSGNIISTFASTIKQENHLNSLTGINSFELLDSITKLVTITYPDKKIHKLSVKDRIILVFMKLKMALKLNVLSFLFKISPSMCKKTFVEYIGYLANILKTCIHWPSFEECQQNMPICFSSFRKVRIVLDCLEIPIEKPKCLCCRIRTYSHYKGKQTIKIMTGVSPAGLITFVSKSYGGRTSDKAIFTQSNLVNQLQPNQDSIMVDKGFLIDQLCNEHFIKLIRPHFLRNKKQFTENESKENVLISKARVHIERVNQRIRIFNILNIPLPNTLIPLINDIMLIICGMVNLQNPVLADDKF